MLLLSLISHSLARFEHIFKKIGELERFVTFLNVKMSAKSNETELREEFMIRWRDGGVL